VILILKHLALGILISHRWLSVCLGVFLRPIEFLLRAWESSSEFSIITPKPVYPKG
jgi:hypothetical protein